jgi:hypothetical protein
MNIFFPHHLVLYLIFVNWDHSTEKYVGVPAATL